MPPGARVWKSRVHVLALLGREGGEVALHEFKGGERGGGFGEHVRAGVHAGDVGAGEGVEKDFGRVARAAAEVVDSGVGESEAGGYLRDEVVDGAGAFVAELEVLGCGPVFLRWGRHAACGG
ncbi:hypothetical protein OPT61_g5687 [Boeremia exigua]|uniref:Uncharacterized protein n=1 Tax=Boeremia exigua TaxID=749465 RepID=A0ACC2I9N0_9PLEO|nr:hypothetical protein OPT61_g5687 [Boeremia exigua]